MKRSLSRAASAVGAAIILSAVSFAGPAQATYACWDTGYGTECRDYRESAAGLAKVRAAEHPTFTGILKAGETLTSSPGVWLYGQDIGTDTLKYQWLRDGVGIPGAIGETYRITKSDTGRSLALRVSASAAGVNDGVETTLPSPKVSEANTAEYTARPGISGEAPVVWGWTRVGFTLEVSSLGTWSPSWMTIKLQWQADGEDIEGATAGTYTIKTADLGKTVTLKVTGISAGVPSVSMSNTSTAVTPGYIDAGEEMWLSGGDKVGSTLSVERSIGGWYAGGELITLLYQWERDGQAIAGATASTYTVVAADSGHWVRARVTATAPGYLPNTQTTLYTDIVDTDTGGNGGVEPGGEPTPVPVPEPVPEPAPEPSPVPAPTETAPAEPAPADPAPADPAPALQTPAAPPLARTSPAQKYVPAETGGDVQLQAAGPVQAAITGAVEPADTAAAPAESSPAAQAPAATAGPSPSPSPSAASAPAAATTQAAATPFNPLPVFFTVAGVLIAAGLVWVIRPLRASVARIAGRKNP